MATRGRFISFEGGEGVGKSTVLGQVGEFLQDSGIKVCATREPGGTPAADLIRSVFAKSEVAMSAWTELFLVCAARRDHVEKVIAPALAAGQWVLCDRFADSSRVYQGIVGGVDDESLEWCLKLATTGLEPDLTLVLDCNPDVTARRLLERHEAPGANAVTRYDEASQRIHQLIRRGFLEVAAKHPGRSVVLDAEESVAKVTEATCHEISRRFSKSFTP